MAGPRIPEEPASKKNISKPQFFLLIPLASIKNYLNQACKSSHVDDVLFLRRNILGNDSDIP